MNMINLSNRVRVSTLAVLFSGVAVAICVSIPGTRAQSSGEPIKIGGMFSTTGILAGSGSEALAGAQILIEEVNAAGGINGRPLQLVYADDESRPNKPCRNSSV